MELIERFKKRRENKRAVKRFKERRAERLVSRFDEEPKSWITVNGNHIPLDEEGKPIGGQAKAFGEETVSDVRKSRELAVKPTHEYEVVLEDDDLQWRRRNLSVLKPIYKEMGGGPEFHVFERQEFYLSKMQALSKNIEQINPTGRELRQPRWGDEQTPLHERFLDADAKQKAHDAALSDFIDVVRDGTLAEWTVMADDEVKPTLMGRLLSSQKARNASLTLMYLNYLENGGKPMDFQEWLFTTVTLYRGEKGQPKSENDVWEAYTFSYEVARSFAGYYTPPDGETSNNAKEPIIREITIRPIDTLGSPRTKVESEVWIPYWIEGTGRKLESHPKKLPNGDSRMDFKDFIINNRDSLQEVYDKGGMKAVRDAFENRTDAEFKEEDHPRDESGKFSSGGGSSVDTAKNAFQEKRESSKHLFDEAESRKSDVKRMSKEADRLENERKNASWKLNFHKQKYGDDLNEEQAKERAELEKKEREAVAASEEAQRSLTESRKKYDEASERIKKEVYESKEAEEYRKSVLSKYPSYDACKSASEVAERLRATGTVCLDASLDGFDRMDMDVARSVAESIDAFGERCPLMKNEVRDIRMTEPTHGSLRGAVAYANSNTGEVFLVERFFGNKSRLESNHRSGMAAGF